VPLRIACDLDGVLADMETELVRQAAKLFGDSITAGVRERPTGAGDGGSDASSDNGREPAAESQAGTDEVPPLPTLTLTARQQRQLWAHVESIDDFWTTLNEVEPGVVDRLARLATEKRWEVIFLTKRPETRGATAQLQSQRWLQSKGFPLPSVYVVQGSRGHIAAALGLDVVVDDRPENCLDVVTDSKARAILVSRDSKAPAAVNRLGIGVVTSVDECLAILTQIDSLSSGRPTMIDRAMQLLGLKQPAGA
jgi:hypothetical protein